MKNFVHKTVVNDQWVVTRKIPVNFQNSELDEKNLNGTFRGLSGLVDINVDRKKSIIFIEYDVTQIQYQTVLDMIVKAGCAIKGSLWFRWKQGWIEFTETNMRDNAKAPPPACCNKPPK